MNADYGNSITVLLILCTISRRITALSHRIASSQGLDMSECHFCMRGELTELSYLYSLCAWVLTYLLPIQGTNSISILQSPTDEETQTVRRRTDSSEGGIMSLPLGKANLRQSKVWFGKSISVASVEGVCLGLLGVLLIGRCSCPGVC